MVEQSLRKGEVGGSNPLIGSRKSPEIGKVEVLPADQTWAKSQPRFQK